MFHKTHTHLTYDGDFMSIGRFRCGGCGGSADPSPEAIESGDGKADAAEFAEKHKNCA